MEARSAYKRNYRVNKSTSEGTQTAVNDGSVNEDQDTPDTRSPFFTEDVPEPYSSYWSARRKLAAAMRELQEQVLTADVSEAEALALTGRIEAETSILAELNQVAGVIANARRKQHGNIAVANHELLAVGGHSHPGAPGLKIWHEGDETRGSVQCGWAFEGPPGHVHGGWVAGILDHFMGIAQMRSGQPGMTGSLDIRYHRPTPLNVALSLRASHEIVSPRRTKVIAEIMHEDKITASAVALFIRPTSNIFQGLNTA